MIALRSNLEMKATFNRLIEAMGERVKWKELFIIVDNYVILYGEVRSLFFNFDNKKVVSNIIDISVKDSDIKDIDELNEKYYSYYLLNDNNKQLSDTYSWKIWGRNIYSMYIMHLWIYICGLP